MCPHRSSKKGSRDGGGLKKEEGKGSQKNEKFVNTVNEEKKRGGVAAIRKTALACGIGHLFRGPNGRIGRILVFGTVWLVFG
jgi:hypothetical protein